MSNTTSIEQPTFRVSPRRVLRPGLTFRTVRGSGPTSGRRPIGPHGTFRCLRLYRTGRGGKRVFASAICEDTGGVHDLYLAGPQHTTKTGTRMRPFRIKLLRSASR